MYGDALPILSVTIQPKHQILFMSAAVGDYRPKKVAASKIKKVNRLPQLELTENPDILKALSKIKHRAKVVGFSVESKSVLAEAKRKLKAKKLDLMIAQQATHHKKPFGAKAINSWFVFPDEKSRSYKEMTKNRLALSLIRHCSEWF